MKIAIVTSDNDFNNTWYGVLTFINQAYIWTNGNCMKLPRAELEATIHGLAPHAYLCFQSRHPREHDITHTLDYIKNMVRQILIDKEVDEYIIKNASNGNCEVTILDTDLNYENSRPIYCF